MTTRIYVRIAKRPNWVRGDRYKVAASHNRQDDALTQGDLTLRTLHFAIDLEVPDVVFKDPAMPVVKVQVQSDGAFATEPVVVQVPIEAAASS